MYKSHKITRFTEYIDTGKAFRSVGIPHSHTEVLFEALIVKSV